MLSFKDNYSHLIIAIIIIILLYSFISLSILYIPVWFAVEAYWNTKNILVKHGAFPSVSVWVWHGEPGNLHPYNFEA